MSQITTPNPIYDVTRPMVTVNGPEPTSAPSRSFERTLSDRASSPQVSDQPRSLSTEEEQPESALEPTGSTAGEGVAPHQAQSTDVPRPLDNEPDVGPGEAEVSGGAVESVPVENVSPAPIVDEGEASESRSDVAAASIGAVPAVQGTIDLRFVTDGREQASARDGDSPSRLGARARAARSAEVPSDADETRAKEAEAPIRAGAALAAGEATPPVVDVPETEVAYNPESRFGITPRDLSAARSTPIAAAGEFVEIGRRFATGKRLEARQDESSQASSERATQSASSHRASRSEAVFQIERLADAGSIKPESQTAATPLIRTGKGEASTLPSQAHGVDGRLVAQSVSRGLSAALQQREGEVVLRLAPPSLGLVRIQMTLDHGTVSVRLETTTQGAQQILGDQVGALRASLEARGLSVDRVSVQHAPPASAPPSNGAPQSSSQHQQHAASGSQQDLSGEQDAGGAPSKGRQDGSSDADSTTARTGPSELPLDLAFDDFVNLHLEVVA